MGSCWSKTTIRDGAIKRTSSKSNLRKLELDFIFDMKSSTITVKWTVNITYPCWLYHTWYHTLVWIGTILHAFMNFLKRKLKRSIWLLKKSIWVKRFSTKFKTGEILWEKSKGFGCIHPVACHMVHTANSTRKIVWPYMYWNSPLRLF